MPLLGFSLARSAEGDLSPVTKASDERGDTGDRQDTSSGRTGQFEGPSRDWLDTYDHKYVQDYEYGDEAKQ